MKLSDFVELSTYLYQDPEVNLDSLLKEAKIDVSTLKTYLISVINCLQEVTNWNVESIESALRDLQVQSGLKPRPAFMSIRLVLTGSHATPPLFDVIELLSRSNVLKRLTSFVDSL